MSSRRGTQQVIEAFRQAYGHGPRYVARSPGRVNLLGEHTDYNDGFVLPMAVDRSLWVAASARSDDRIRMLSLEFGGHVLIGTLEDDDRLPHWTRYVRGAWCVLRDSGRPAPGADIVIGSEIPVGAGLASSAALGVALVEIVLALAATPQVEQRQKAQWAQALEHRFVGVPCGIMDQMAVATAQAGSALYLDCRTLETVRVPVPATTRLVVMDTMTKRRLVDSGYAQRRTECQTASRLLGVTALRDATREMLARNGERLGSVLYRRARHVVSENARTQAMRSALEIADLAAAGALMNASHASLRDDYDVSSPELDMITDVARLHSHCYGARLTGAGFGGSAVALVRADGADAFAAHVGSQYAGRCGLRSDVYVCAPAAGSTIETVTA